MSPSLSRMTALVPPPTQPVAPGSPQNWIRVESDLGVQLPSDFKEYTATYGAGHWADFFGIYDPFYEWKHPQLSKTWADWRRLRLGMLDEMREQFPKYTAPFSAYPAEDGLLAFGYTHPPRVESGAVAHALQDAVAPSQAPCRCRRACANLLCFDLVFRKA